MGWKLLEGNRSWEGVTSIIKTSNMDVRNWVLSPSFLYSLLPHTTFTVLEGGPACPPHLHWVMIQEEWTLIKRAFMVYNLLMSSRVETKSAAKHAVIRRKWLYLNINSVEDEKHVLDWEKIRYSCQNQESKQNTANRPSCNKSIMKICMLQTDWY